jgi:hypothetical protein
VSEKPKHGIFIGLPNTMKVPTFLVDSNNRYYYIEQRSYPYKININMGGGGVKIWLMLDQSY